MMNLILKLTSSKMERIYHRWDQWECYRAGFFEEHPPKGMTHDQCHEAYKELLTDIWEFKRVMYEVVNEWDKSCEHNLTNDKMNRIAWMGQAALTKKYGIPSKYRGGFNLLTPEEQHKANSAALEVINYWMFMHGEPPHTMKTIESKTEANLY
jgi:hypothetical protein